MQTFLPDPDFQKSARALDSLRLGKQRPETLQILNALSNPNYGWQNHPAVQMWRGAEAFLIQYGFAICEEWKRRGYNDTVEERLHVMLIGRRLTYGSERDKRPWWLGDPRLHISHQSNLLRKAPWAYAHLWPDVPRDLEYWWPSREER